MKKDQGIVVKFYRVESWLFRHKMKFLSKIIYKIIYILFNCVIPPSVIIGKNFHIAHSVGVVFHHELVIGDNCIIYQNVTIGGGKIEIGNNCIIGTNAVVLGPLKIGNNVKIGALTFVNYDVKSNTTVVGYKGKIQKE